MRRRGTDHGVAQSATQGAHDRHTTVVTPPADDVDDRAVRTAMSPLDPASGEPRVGPWQALRARVARSVRGVRWWLRRRGPSNSERG